jgi:hypothetical protein
MEVHCASFVPEASAPTVTNGHDRTIRHQAKMLIRRFVRHSRPVVSLAG